MRPRHILNDKAKELGVEGRYRVLVKQGQSHFEDEYDSDGKAAEWRAVLANMYDALPAYRSAAFWHIIEEFDRSTALPLEVLVRCVRMAVARGDDEGRNRIVAVIIQRTHIDNECWARNVLKTMFIEEDERHGLVGDLFADLYECLIRVLIDPERLFWEENFQHCLRFERQHVYRAFMNREGRWNNQQVKQSRRIPHILVESLDHLVQAADVDIEDELAQEALFTSELTDLLCLVLHLPEKFRTILLLTFWEDKTPKETAKVLGVTDRTVRNRLRDALKILQGELEPGRELVSG